jgi:hypothetical protein
VFHPVFLQKLRKAAAVMVKIERRIVQEGDDFTRSGGGTL